MKYSIVVGYEEQGLIGVDNKLLIECKDDLKRFYQITTEEYPEGSLNVLIMGYKTWQSIPDEVKPFKKRISIVVTRNHASNIQCSETLKSASSLDEAFQISEDLACGRTFVIGGSSLFRECHERFSQNLECLYVTQYKDQYIHYDDSLIHFPEVLLNNTRKVYMSPLKFSLAIVNIKSGFFSTHLYHSLNIYHKETHVNNGENEYLQLLHKVFTEGTVTEGRNGKTTSLFGERMVFDLAEGFPLLTTKKMGYRTILRELLWFLSGSTNNRHLKDKNVHIWDENASREFLDSRGLSYREDELGPVYGFQWRHFGAEYQDCDTDYRGKGYDQIKRIVQQVKEEPESRRIILSAWNPPELDKMALPPCHVLCQFHVDRAKGLLDCQLYQRSGDMFLGVPFNIASYAFLTHILAHLTGLKAGKLIHVLGDSHIYEAHSTQVTEQLKRVPVSFPKIHISEELTDIDAIDESMIQISGYQSYPRIRAPMIA
jgi:dihydrofolate reductase/thymidylate synthase